MDLEDIRALEDMLACSLTLEDTSTSEKILTNITYYFRELRTMCSKGKGYQDAVIETEVISHTTDVIRTLITDKMPKTEHSLDCLRVGIQVIGNVVVDNINCKTFIWERYQTLIRELLYLDDCKAANYAAMVTYNIIKDNPNVTFEQLNSLLTPILNLASQESEFSIFCLEYLVCIPGIISKSYLNLGIGERLFLLEICRELLSKGTEKKLPCSEDIHYLCEIFKKKADAIFTLSTNTPEPTESSALLETLATASGLQNSDIAIKLQNDTSLFISAIFILKNVHECFTVEEKLTSLDPLGSRMPELKNSPVYGFKAQLIRLIGNLCFRHQSNQDKIREVEGIQLLLNCSRLDASNPFITQWVILAMRNLCEGNVENQAIISSMRQESDAPIVDSILRLKPDANTSKMNFV